MQANAPSSLDPYWNNTYTINAASLLCGFNDASQGATPATIYSRITLWVTHCHQNHAARKCIVATWPDTDYLSETDRATLNASITGNTAGADAITDFAADPTIGCSGCDANSTYFTSPPNIHPKQPAQNIMGTIMKNTLTGLGFPN